MSKKIDLNEFFLLYNNALLPKEDILKQLNITEYFYKKIIKEFKLIRNRTSEFNRIKNQNLDFFKNQNITFKSIDEPAKEFYSNIKTQQEEPKDILPNEPKPKRNIKTKVVKIIEDIEKPVKRSNKKQEPKKNENKEPIKEPLKNEINDELKNLKNKIISRTDENIAKYKK